MMSPRQALETVLRGERPDRIVFAIYENKIPRCWAERQLRNRGVCVIERSVPLFTTIHKNVEIESRTFNEDGKSLIRTEYKTPYGTLTHLVEKTQYTSWSHKRLFENKDDYKTLHYLIENTYYKPNYERFMYAQKIDGDDSLYRPSIPGEPLQQLISWYMGTEKFCMEWCDNQDEILKLYEILADKNRQVYEICANSPALAFNYGGNVVPEIFGVEGFEKYYVPHYNEAAEVLHKKDKLVGVHFDANCKLLSKSIAATKLDYIEAFTPAPSTDMTLAEARQAWPDKVLWINFPSAIHIESNEVVRQTTRDLLNQLDPYDKFLMGITEDVPENRWRESFMAISDVLLDYNK